MKEDSPFQQMVVPFLRIHSSGLRLKLRSLFPPASLKAGTWQGGIRPVGWAQLHGYISKGSRYRVAVCRVGYGQWLGITKKSR